MLCGTSSFKHVDKDHWSSPAPHSPARGSFRKRTSKNPYSDRGLDKFSTVMEELGSRKDKIMAEAGRSPDLVMVRFQHSGCHDDWIPIIVKLPAEGNTKAAATASPKSPQEAPPLPPVQGSGVQEKEAVAAATVAVPEKERLSWASHWRRVRGGWDSWPLVLVLVILVCLVAFGRAFAICCTSIWWYLMPTMGSGHEAAGLVMRGSFKKKKKQMYERRALSDKKMGEKVVVAAASLPPSQANKGREQLLDPSPPTGRRERPLSMSF